MLCSKLLGWLNSPNTSHHQVLTVEVFAAILTLRSRTLWFLKHREMKCTAKMEAMFDHWFYCIEECGLRRLSWRFDCLTVLTSLATSAFCRCSCEGHLPHRQAKALHQMARSAHRKEVFTHIHAHIPICMQYRCFNKSSPRYETDKKLTFRAWSALTPCDTAFHPELNDRFKSSEDWNLDE